MSHEETPQQVENGHIDKLGPVLGPFYHALWNDLAWLQVKWQEFREAFGTTPKRVELLNSSAGLFFRIVQDTLWADTLLHICRLTDPPKSAGKENLTLKALPPLITDPKLRSEISALVDHAVTSTAFARDWRNRHLSHNDLALALNKGAQPLAIASSQQVANAIAAIHAVLNRISEQLLKSTLASEVFTPPTGVLTLMSVLQDGLNKREVRLERLRRGKHFSENLGPPAV
jgi:hypothetical protein